MDNRNRHTPEPWEQDSYRTGSTHPPKSHSGAIAVLLTAVILLSCGLIPVYAQDTDIAVEPIEFNNPDFIRELKPEEWEVKMGDLAKDGTQLRPYIVWFGEYVPAMEVAEDYVRELLGVKDGYRIYCIIAIGYPQEEN